jgi:hypothetical protein
MDAALEQLVRSRAQERCEYCHASQRHYRDKFPVDHIVARQHRGATVSENLALACLECNLRKGPNIASLDPESGQLVALFHPRKDVWNDHFAWRGAVLVGLSAVGRATVTLLELNRSSRVVVRESLIEERVFPPPADRRV